MNIPQTDTSLFKRLRFVLVEPSHPGNIGAVSRAMKTMGFHELIVVNPRFPDALTQPEAIAFASGAQDILENAKIVGSVEEALAGCNYAAAVTARLREFSPPILAPRELALQLASNSSLRAAIVFGNERFGLPNEAIEKCNVLINIAANPDYSSLNLAQAAQILAYECRIAILGDRLPTTVIGFQGHAATLVQIEGMFEHLEHALVAIDFLDANNPKKLMSRLRRLFSRAQLEVEEVNILRGVCKQIMGKLNK